MKIESPGFTEADLQGFYEEVIAHEQRRPADDLTLADRLEAASDRLEELVGEMVEGGDGSEPGGEEWNAREVLAHIGLISQLYGWITWAIATGEQAEIDLTSIVTLRDVAGAQRAQLPARELLAMAQTEHRDTIEFLRSVDPQALKRRAKVGPFDMSAEEAARLPLCAHLELHVRQLEEALLASRGSHPV